MSSCRKAILLALRKGEDLRGTGASSLDGCLSSAGQPVASAEKARLTRKPQAETGVAGEMVSSLPREGAVAKSDLLLEKS